MAINFPTPTAVGETFTEPTNGNVYICSQISPAVWWGSVTTGNLDTVYLRLDASNDPMTGALETLGIAATGQASANQTEITGNTWDLSIGNNWTAGVIAIPQPTNGVVGQSGTLVLTAAPSSWPAIGGTLKYPGGVLPNPLNFPAVIPFYVASASVVYLGNVTEAIT